MRILIANRGEIACRVIRAAHGVGHQTVAAYADPDHDAPFVADATDQIRLGPAELSSSYLSIEAVLEAAARTGADALHPGYGFLSESARFAEAVIDAGVRWIGPRPEIIARMGSKIEARALASAADVPTIPGYDESQEPTDLATAAARIGYPVLVKASAGGGGKGIRIAWQPEDFDGALRDAAAEAERAFGDSAMIVERFIQRPRHVEVQVVGDRHGTVIDLGTRECSLQRRYQKIVEEAPAPNLPDETRSRLRADARRLAASVGYDSVGTVEFIVDDDTGDHFFLEMNTRLQVEHPVTELVTGLDLVQLQLLVAQDRPLPLGQEDVVLEGHAFEARINAEDPWGEFFPETGTVSMLRVPPGARWDAGIEAGTTITTHYDPMIAKLIVGGRDRDVARQRLIAALDGLVIAGLSTNAGFVRWLLQQPPVVEGRVTTRFVDEVEFPPAPALEPIATAAARVWQSHRDRDVRGRDVWARARGFRVTPHRAARSVALAHADGEWEVELDSPELAAAAVTADAVDLDRRIVAVTVDGESHTFRVLSREERWSQRASDVAAGPGAVRSPFPATVAEVHIGPGDDVEAGQIVIVLEAMKMLHSLTAPAAGTVEGVRVSVGDQVDSKEILASFAEPDRTSE